MRSFGAVLSVVIALSGISAASAAEDKDTIEYRQHIMKSLDAQVAILGMILSGAAPEDNLVSHLDTIAMIAQGALQSFEAKVPGGESSPEVWAKWADYSQRMNSFAAATAKVAKIAREQGKDAIMGEVAGALSCKSCHDVYRKK